MCVVPVLIKTYIGRLVYNNNNTNKINVKK